MQMTGKGFMRAVVLAAIIGGVGAARVDAAGCTVSATSVLFGAYNVFTTAPTDTLGTITYNCNGGAKNVLITITAGQAGTVAPRTLGSALDRLSYNLYRDSARASVWGNTASQALVVGDPPNNTNVTVTMFGRIPAGQDVRAGTYSDNVSVVVNY